jgi:hypothetical protein
MRSACTKRKDCNVSEVFCGRNCNKKVDSYTLYGNNLLYTDGATANAELMLKSIQSGLCIFTLTIQCH